MQKKLTALGAKLREQVNHYGDEFMDCGWMLDIIYEELEKLKLKFPSEEAYSLKQTNSILKKIYTGVRKKNLSDSELGTLTYNSLTPIKSKPSKDIEVLLVDTTHKVVYEGITFKVLTKDIMEKGKVAVREYWVYDEKGREIQGNSIYQEGEEPVEVVLKRKVIFTRDETNEKVEGTVEQTIIRYFEGIL